jgi:glucokinase
MYIGIDFGGTNIAVGIVDENGKVIIKDSVPTNVNGHYTEIIKDMAELSLKLVKEVGISLENICSIGIGTPGTVDKEKGVLLYMNNIDFKNVPMVSEMKKYIDLPIYIDNDANCAALAEATTGAAKDTNSSITITLGTGVGGGIIIDKKLYSGFNYSGGELGHIVIKMDGEQCTCGRKGCWEAYASATALIRITKKAAEANPKSMINELIENDLENISGKTAFIAAGKGDDTAKQVVNEYIKYLAEGMTNVINIFQPEMVVIGGGVGKEGDNLLDPLREKISQDVYCKEVEQTVIKAAQMGNDAGIVGAAMLKE